MDPRAELKGLEVSGGVALLHGLELPGRGLSVPAGVVYWSGSVLSPEVDSLLLCGGGLILGGEGDGAKDPSGGASIPPCRLSGFSLVSDGDTTGVFGRYSGSGPEDSMRFMLSGGWGSALGVLSRTPEGDSVRIPWFQCRTVPGGVMQLPDALTGCTLEGSLSAFRGDSTVARGTIRKVDGQAAQVEFSVLRNRSGDHFQVSSRLRDVREVLIASSRQLLGDVHIDFLPRGVFTLEFHDTDTVGIFVDAMLDSLEIYSPGLADDTLRFDAALCFRGTVRPENWEFYVDSGTVSVDSLTSRFDLRGSCGERRRICLRLYNDSLPGSAAAGLPEALLGPLRGMSLGGRASFDITTVLDWEYPDSSDFSASVNVSGLHVYYSPVSVGQLREGGACRMRDSWGNSRTIMLDTLNNGSFMPFDSLHPSFEGLLRCAEDATFRTHHGFCLYHIRNSIRANMASGRFTRGGSTITMQLARNLFLNRDKTMARKIQEVFLTWRLEVYLSKDRMLEIYANIVELGPDVFGFREAARYYFGRDFSDLTTRETAYLVSILPGPRLYHRFYDAGRLPEYWSRYLDRLIRIAENRNWIHEDSASSALTDSIVFCPPSNPR